MKKVAILFPNCNAARLLGIRLIETQNIVVAYCPSKEDIETAANIIEEWTILSMEQQGQHGATVRGPPGLGNSRFSLQTGEDFLDCDLLVLPSLDALRFKSDKEYAAMVESHFKEMKSNGFNISEGTKIIFGSNHGGLIAGTIWGQIWPEHKMHILAASSIFDASVKVFGKTSSSRAIPLHRRGDVFFNDETDHETTEHRALSTMGMAYNFDDYSTLEAKLLHNVVTLLLEDEDLEELEVIGKFPTKDEAAKYKVEEGKMNWFPTIDDLSWLCNFVSQQRPVPSTTSSKP